MSNFNPTRRAARKARKDRRGYALANDGSPKPRPGDKRFTPKSR